MRFDNILTKIFSEEFRAYFTLQRDWKGDILWGALFAIGFILLNLTVGISIGFPTQFQATQGEKIGIIVGAAPFAEDLLFVAVLQPALDIVSNSILGVFITGGVFSLIHVKAYAGSFSLQGIQAVSGALLGAFIFRVATGLLILWRKSFYTGWIAHLMVNGFLVIKFASEVLVISPVS